MPEANQTSIVGGMQRVTTMSRRHGNSGTRVEATRSASRALSGPLESLGEPEGLTFAAVQAVTQASRSPREANSIPRRRL